MTQYTEKWLVIGLLIFLAIIGTIAIDESKRRENYNALQIEKTKLEIMILKKQCEINK